MNRKLTIVFVFWLIILASLLVACQPKEVEVTRVVEQEVIVEVTRVVEQEVTVEVTRVVEQEVTVEVTRVVEVDAKVPVSLSELAKQIRNGEIDVGAEYGMALDQRFHQIHSTTLGMECTRCHVTKAPLEIAPPPSDSPGPIDRRVCLGCHVTGPASELYTSQE
jgi:hypothetical protein